MIGIGNILENIYILTIIQLKLKVGIIIHAMIIQIIALMKVEVVMNLMEGGITGLIGMDMRNPMRIGMIIVCMIMENHLLMKMIIMHGTV